MSDPSVKQPEDTLPNLVETVRALVPLKTAKRADVLFKTQAFKQAIKVFCIPAPLHKPSTVMSIGLVLSLCARGADTRPTSWQSWVLTFAVMCFPELKETITADNRCGDYQFEYFTSAFITECTSAIEAQMDEETVGPKIVTLPDDLPECGDHVVDVELASSANIEAIYAYFAMIVFIMGKSIGPENIVSISTKRPDALIRKRGLSDYEYILIGDGKMATANYRHIQAGWIRSTGPRIVIVTHLAKLVDSGTHSGVLDSVVVNMELLKNANQTYMFYIHELLVSCTWVTEIVPLKAAFYKYAKMVNVLTSQEDYLRPYYKLMMQDNARDLKRRDIEPLIAVAGFFASQTRTTMNQYRVTPGSRAIVEQFQSLAKAKGITFSDVTQQLTTEANAI